MSRRIFDVLSRRRGHFHPCVGLPVVSLEASVDTISVVSIVSMFSCLIAVMQ